MKILILVLMVLISFLHLSYQLRIESMLMCEETSVLLEMLQPKAETIRKACEGKGERNLLFRTVLHWCAGDS